MKNFTKVCVLSLVMICSVFTVNAQKKGKVNIEEKSKTETAAAIANLNLDEATATKLYEINLNAYQENRVIAKEFKAKAKAGEAVNKEDKKAARKAVWQKADTSIKELLGKDQFKAYQTARKAYKKTLKAKKKK